MNRIILGLDISTTCTGVSIVLVNEKEEITPIVVTHLRQKAPTKIKGIESLFLKCNMFIDKLDEIIHTNKLDGIITDVVIEEPLISSNNKYTVATLLRYNGMVAYRVYNLIGVVPKFISSADARMFGVPSLMAVRQFNKKGDAYAKTKIMHAVKHSELVMFGAYPFDCAKKYILWNYISQRFPGIKWVYDKHDELQTENFDASDSLICIIGLLGYEKYHDTRPVVTKYNDGENSVTYTYDFCGQTFDKAIPIH